MTDKQNEGAAGVPSEERLAEIVANHEQGELIFDDSHRVHADRRDLLRLLCKACAELATCQWERDDWKRAIEVARLAGEAQVAELAAAKNDAELRQHYAEVRAKEAEQRGFALGKAEGIEMAAERAYRWLRDALVSDEEAEELPFEIRKLEQPKGEG